MPEAKFKVFNIIVN